jgi:hypothetical protein
MLFDITDPFDFDSLFFEATSQGLLTGRINQKEKRFEILAVKARDYIPDISQYIKRVNHWINNIEEAEQFLLAQMNELRGSNNKFNESMSEKVIHLLNK